MLVIRTLTRPQVRTGFTQRAVLVGRQSAVRSFQSRTKTLNMRNKYGDTFSHRDNDEDEGRYEQRRPSQNRDRGNQSEKSPQSDAMVRLSFTPQALDPKVVSSWRKDNEISVTGSKVPDPIMDFDSSPFGTALITRLKAQYEAPMPIQSQGWSVSLSGKDMIGRADTGSGKTVAFLLPAFEHIRLQPTDNFQRPRVLVLAPTRELAQQIEAEANKFARYSGIRVACLFGGQGTRFHQIRQLERNPHIIVATPGRLLDLTEAGHVELGGVNFLVLDEADRMLDMGFEQDVRRVIDLISPERQTQMWTATWPKSVERLSRDYLQDAVKVNVGSESLSANPNVKQEIEVTTRVGKLPRLVQLLNTYAGSKVLVFVGTKVGCDSVGRALYTNGIRDVALLHGDKTQAQRDSVVTDFKLGRLKCVVATDVAARGLDVKDIDVVINYDFPNNIETYIHRIGRTARAGKTGTAISLMTDDDAPLVRDLMDILKGAGQEIPPELTAMLNLMPSKGGRGGGHGGRSGGYGGRPGGFGGRTGGFGGRTGGGNRRGSETPSYRDYSSLFKDDDDVSTPRKPLRKFPQSRSSEDLDGIFEDMFPSDRVKRKPKGDFDW